MGEQLKRRLTGAAVLLLAAGLAWPLLFNFDDTMRGSEFDVEVPVLPDDAPSPSSRTAKQAEPLKPADRKPAPAASAPEPSLGERLSAEAEQLLKRGSKDTASANNDAQRGKPKLDQQKIPVSYVVQVATFNGWENARNFRQSLLDNGFKAYIKPPSPTQSGPYRIAVGPVLTYAEAEEIAALIETRHKIMDTIIRRLRDV
ncbi:MAG: SPOR domain-containing protein [Pseudomonadales bacterium]